MNDKTYITFDNKKLFRVGLGTNRIRSDKTSRDALEKAVQLGINFIDSASAYTGGQSEKMIGETLPPYENIVIGTKGGMVAPDFHIDSRPEMLERQLKNSLEKLKLKTIELYFLHRVDPKVPMKESVSFLKKMQEEGKIKHIGLSHVSVDQIEEAREITDIAAVENEYNLSTRGADPVIDYCERNNIIFIPYYPLHFSVTDEEAFAKLMEKYHATKTQLALAWLLKCSPVILPIPGSLSSEHLEENVKAAKIELSDEDFHQLSESAAS